MDSASSLEELTLTQFEGFVCEVRRRSELKNAPYNPRRISDAARKKLRNGIKKLKLLGPVQWNKRTGNLVGGHQRLSILDQMETKPDYLLTVAVVDLDEKQEKEANLLLNNWSAQGDWDPEKLNEMLPGLDLEATGFDDADVMRMLGDQVDNAEAQKLEEMADRLRAGREGGGKTARRRNMPWERKTPTQRPRTRFASAPTRGCRYPQQLSDAGCLASLSTSGSAGDTRR